MSTFIVTYSAIVDDGNKEWHLERIDRIALESVNVAFAEAKAKQLLPAVAAAHIAAGCKPEIDEHTDVEVMVTPIDIFIEGLLAHGKQYG